jgi:hypothetical protein
MVRNHWTLNTISINFNLGSNIVIFIAQFNRATTEFCFFFFSPTADPPEYNKLYGIPAAAFLAGYGYCAQAGTYPDIHQMAYLAASLCCVGALTGLSSQTTSRLGELFVSHYGTVCTGVWLLRPGRHLPRHPSDGVPGCLSLLCRCTHWSVLTDH